MSEETAREWAIRNGWAPEDEQGGLAEDRRLVEEARPWLGDEVADRLAARLDDAEERDTLREALSDMVRGHASCGCGACATARARLSAVAAPREASEE